MGHKCEYFNPIIFWYLAIPEILYTTTNFFVILPVETVQVVPGRSAVTGTLAFVVSVVVLEEVVVGEWVVVEAGSLVEVVGNHRLVVRKQHLVAVVAVVVVVVVVAAVVPDMVESVEKRNCRAVPDLPRFIR